MPVKSSLRTFILIISAAGLVLALGSCLRAGGYKCHCEPSIAIFDAPFYGYYPTCWRPWPPGQPPCPCYAHEPAAAPAPPAGTSERTIEVLPPPRPEEPEDKEAK